MKTTTSILIFATLMMVTTSAFASETSSGPTYTEPRPDYGTLYGIGLLNGAMLGVAGYVANTATAEDTLAGAISGLIGAAQWTSVGLMMGVHLIDDQASTRQVAGTGVGSVIGAGAGLALGFGCGLMFESQTTGIAVCAPLGFMVAGAGSMLGYHLDRDTDEERAEHSGRRTHATTGLVAGSVVGLVGGNVLWRGVASVSDQTTLTVGGIVGGTLLGIGSAAVGYHIGSQFEKDTPVSFAPMFTDEGTGVAMFGRF